MRTESYHRSATEFRDLRATKPFEYGVLAAMIAGCLAVGGLGNWLTSQSMETWYPSLTRPPLTPPGWVFGPVWTTLYVMMGAAAWLVWQCRRIDDVRGSLTLFAVQLGLNLAWSGLFFTLQSPGAALIEIAVLWFAIGATCFAFRRHRVAAAALLVPYWMWVTFATYLNAGFWWFNR